MRGDLCARSNRVPTDGQIHFDGDSWNEPGNNLYGCFKALYLLKKQNRYVNAHVFAESLTLLPLDGPPCR